MKFIKTDDKTVEIKKVALNSILGLLNIIIILKIQII